MSSLGGRQVLVVEDAPDTRDFFVDVLEHAGCSVLCAESVQEALTLLRAGHHVDVVIVDYSLGDGTGAALIHQAVNEGCLDPRATRTLICTGYRYVELPPNVALLHKPVGSTDLLRHVARALGDVGPRG
jgi:CheY-like chemotaxis protein